MANQGDGMVNLITDPYGYDEDGGDLPEFTQEEADGIRSLLVGHRVEKVGDDHLLLDDGTVLRVVPNEGCGGCISGGYELDELNGCDNVITSVELVDETPPPRKQDDDGWWDDYDEKHTYRIFVFAEDRRVNLLTVSGDDGNGYYGTGYRVLVRPAK